RNLGRSCTASSSSSSTGLLPAGTLMTSRQTEQAIFLPRSSSRMFKDLPHSGQTTRIAMSRLPNPRATSQFEIRNPRLVLVSDFLFRASDLFRISDFDIRIWDFAPGVLGSSFTIPFMSTTRVAILLTCHPLLLVHRRSDTKRGFHDARRRSLPGGVHRF